MRITTGSRKGQTAILFTLAAVPLFGMLGLVVDIGYAYFRKQAAQAAADSAAGAAAEAAYVSANGGATCGSPKVTCYATEYTCPASPANPPTDNIGSGCLYAKANGFVTTPGKIAVTFQSGVGAAPTASGVTISYWVVARVSEDIPQLFSAVLGFPTMKVVARATTGTRSASGGGCVITLNPSADNALSVSGSASLTSGCGVFVNSNSASALNTNGGGLVTTTGTATTQIVGNCPNNGCNISPAPQTGVSQVTDPFADMSPPTEGTCQSLSALGSQETRTIDPGTYCGTGFNLTSHNTLKLNPGVYILDVTSTAMAIDLSGHATLSGDGVTIYIKHGAVNMTGGTTMTLTAPTTGTWQGILFYQDRADTTAATLEGGSGQTLNGVLYFPKANLTYTGGSASVNTQTTIVSDTLTMVGNSFMSAAASTQFTGVTGGAFLIE
jgi:hypothetical protein